MKKSDTIAAYLHIPFCIRKCPYCSFASEAGVTAARIDETIRYILLECDYYSKLTPWNNKTLHSLFLGGGTPSLLNPEQLLLVRDSLQQNFGFAEEMEFTIEVNPETVTPEILKAWQQCGINRISMGVQTLDPQSLKFLGRIHSVEKAKDAYRMIREAGFTNVSVDLIYGYLADDPQVEWKRTLDEVIRWNPEHISAYSLIIEEETPFYTRTASGENLKVEDSVEAWQYEKVMDELKKSEYRHYEVSNWSKPGFECRHNISYWDNSSYLGIGPSSHGYDGSIKRRYWNHREIDPWRQQIRKVGHGAESSEILTLIQLFEERVMLGLRMIDGIKEKTLKDVAENAEKIWPPAKLEMFINQGYIKRRGGRLIYTRKGLMLANILEAELTT